MIFPMINEGARILEEGIARRPGDIDVIWVYGYGLAGLARRADVLRRRRRAAVHPRSAREIRHPLQGQEVCEPAALLRKLAAEGRSFASLSEKAA